jgi:hypothetical protein
MKKKNENFADLIIQRWGYGILDEKMKEIKKIDRMNII